MIDISFNPRLMVGRTACLALLTQEQACQVGLLKFLSVADQKHLKCLVDAKRFSGKHQEIFPLSSDGKALILCVGLGKKSDVTKTAFCRVVKQALESSYLKHEKRVDIFLPCADDLQIMWLIEGVKIAAYRWKKYIQSDDKNSGSRITVHVQAKKIFSETIKICDGVNFARDLVNDNADVTHAAFLESQLRRLVKGHPRIRLEILGEKALKKKGLNLHLAVNKASQYPPKLMIVRYHGLPAKKEFVALIGKGITYDTGGLNLKPTGSMETMRCDMSGAAAILGTLKNAIALNVKKNVIFVAAIAENAIGSGAYKPGDVIRSYDGKTVEIANTDAEGRLVLADAISYIRKNYKPSKIVDIATLTGACSVALGHDYSGLMTNDDTLAEIFLKCGYETDDRLWRLPLYPELRDQLKSQYADLKSTGLPRGVGGTISAAEFLRQFAGETPWAHLDIAGTAFVESAGRLYFNYGATGSGVRLLTEFLLRV